MERCLSAERIIADGITIFVRRIINFDIRKAMNGLPTPVRGMGGNRDRPPINGTTLYYRETQRQCDNISGTGTTGFRIEKAMDDRQKKFVRSHLNGTRIISTCESR
jgi:hypothetical protein